MGYLQVFGDKLDELMRTRGFTEAQREEIAAYVKETVLQSFSDRADRGSRPPASRQSPCVAPVRQIRHHE